MGVEIESGGHIGQYLAKIARQAEVNALMAAKAGEIQSGRAADRAARGADAALAKAKKK